MSNPWKMKGIFILALIGAMLFATCAMVTRAAAGATNDGQIISDTIPATMEAGKSYTVTVVVKNTGTGTWTAANRYRLAAVGGSDPFTTTIYQNLSSGEEIAAGQQKTFKFTLTAPSAVGTYTTDWRMQQAGVAWFGGTLTKTVKVVLPANNAQIVSDTIPATMESGKSYTVSVVVKNTGTNTWTAAGKYRLGAVGGSDPFTKTLYQNLNAGDSIAPGQQKTFKFTLTAPATLGSSTTDWRMMQGGVAWFGATLTKTVTVIKRANDAVIVSDTIPTVMAAGQSYMVSVVVKNTGTNTWTALGKYRLGAVGGSDPLTTNLYQQLGANDSIATGKQKTFKFTLTAPAGLGTYTTDWRMQQGGVESFGPTLSKSVLVTQDVLSVNNDGHGFTIPTGNIAVESGVAQNITAFPHAGYHFVNWVKVSGDGMVIFKDRNAANTTVTVTEGSAIIRANFAAGIRQSFLNVAAGQYHSYALSSGGNVDSWGYNDVGQLGNGISATSANTPGRVSNLTDVIAVASGSRHGLSVKADGTVWAWGYNGWGQLGNGTNTSSSSRVQVTGLTDVVAVAGGDLYSLALKRDGTVWAWGCNNLGQLGDESNTASNTPIQVHNLANVIAIVSRGAHNLALKSDGTLWAWGYNGNGQLGNGTGVNSNVPVQVQGLTHIVAIGAGSNHSLAIGSDGQVWAWGRGDSGQLGNEGISGSYVPVLVKNLTGAIAVAGGQDFSMALRNDGTVWTWGKGDSGQLGNAAQTASNVPVQVKNLTNVMAIAGGGFHGLALKQDGTGWAWGANSNGELGNGTNTASNVPVQISLAVPNEAVSVIGGVYHSIAIMRDSFCWAWGNNNFGQLGIGTQVNTNSPKPVNGLNHVVAAAGGVIHSVALKNDGTVWAWGGNTYGQLGNGTNTDSGVPVQVKNLTNVVAIVSGTHHNIALKKDGTVWTWGNNGNGQLGNGTKTGSNIPVQVSGLTNVVAISAGDLHSLALKNDGTVWAWGNNLHGQIGNIILADQVVPVPITALTNVVAIAGGGNHNLALNGDGTVWAWGENNWGQLGNNSINDSSAPVQATGLADIATIAAGNYHSLAVKRDGTIYGWGSNYDGIELGNRTPVQITGLTNVAMLACGAHHSLALKDGDIWVWGNNYYGQLGDGSNTSYYLPTKISRITGDAVIDLSNTGTFGFTFGKNDNDQVKRFQTFVANGCPNIYGVDVIIRKNIQGTGIYNTITVELYETDSNQMPTNLLASTTVGTTSLGTAFTVVNAPLKYEGLVAGKTYAIVLGQSDVANVTNNGFEWVTQSNAGSTLKFGKYNGTIWVDETSGLGNGWLKVYVTTYNAHQASPGRYDLQYCRDKDPMAWVYRTGTYEVAVRFPAESIAQYQGGQVTKVWINAIGQACKIRLYGNGTSSSPGAVLSELSYTEGQIIGYGWHEIVLPTPLTIDPGDLWLSYEFQIAAGDSSHGIGADSSIGMGTDGSWARVNGGAWDTEWGSIWKLKVGIQVE